MNFFAHDGSAQIDGAWTAITAAKAFHANLLDIPHDATHYVRYTTGTDYALRPGERLTGGTSLKTCNLVDYAPETGAIATDTEAGVLFVNSISGTMTAAGETLTGSLSAGTVVTIQAPVALRSYGPAKAALISVETASILITFGGILAAITQTYGHIMTAGQNTVIRGISNIRSMRVINLVNANGAVLKYTLYY